MNNKEIVSKLWKLCDVLRDDGITYHQYVTELTYILFLKMSKETGTEDKIPEKYRWDKLVAKKGVEYRMLVMPDHPTPIRCRTHTSDPVPYMIYDNTNKALSGLSYNEKDAAKSGNFIQEGYKTIDKLIS